MKLDPVRQFARIREALLSEKATIEARLAALNAVLETGAASSAYASTKVPSGSLDKIAAEYLERELMDYIPRKGTFPAKILKVLAKRGDGNAGKGYCVSREGQNSGRQSSLPDVAQQGPVEARRSGPVLFGVSDGTSSVTQTWISQRPCVRQ